MYYAKKRRACDLRSSILKADTIIVVVLHCRRRPLNRIIFKFGFRKKEKNTSPPIDVDTPCCRAHMNTSKLPTMLWPHNAFDHVMCFTKTKATRRRKYADCTRLQSMAREYIDVTD